MRTGATLTEKDLFAIGSKTVGKTKSSVSTANFPPGAFQVEVEAFNSFRYGSALSTGLHDDPEQLEPAARMRMSYGIRPRRQVAPSRRHHDASATAFPSRDDGPPECQPSPLPA